jgi:hypothetical protein
MSISAFRLGKIQKYVSRKVEKNRYIIDKSF